MKKIYNPVNEKNTNSALTATLLAATLMLSASTLTAGELKWRGDDSETEVAYVDSVTTWGAWELDIEPAAGGLTPPTTQALNARNSKVALRTNSISALAPKIPATPAVPGSPGTPAIPAIPATPALTPMSPSVPIPVGGPTVPRGGPGS